MRIKLLRPILVIIAPMAMSAQFPEYNPIPELTKLRFMEGESKENGWFQIPGKLLSKVTVSLQAGGNPIAISVHI